MYKINIFKLDEVTREEQEYKRIADSGNEKDGCAVYGYVPVTEQYTKETTVLSQTIDDLDLSAVIKAINKI